MTEGIDGGVNIEAKNKITSPMQYSNGGPKCNGDSLKIQKKNPLTNNLMLNNTNIPLLHHQLVLWKHPILTLKLFFLELSYELHKLIYRLKKNLLKVSILLILLICLYISCYMQGPHQKYLQKSKRKILWCIYWIGLGILSSIGLGTGLHTFVLYLGPHIAAVTIAAYECKSLKFPEPPYPDEIICPSNDLLHVGANGFVSMWSIMRKVYLEAFMWGAGTALGELPPYFMAKAARSSGTSPLDEDYEVFEELLEHQANQELQNLGYLDRVKIYMQNLVQNVGFSGILLCASIPNPLFDFAGITCGHFMVPFWTFFGATLIGKAIIKVHIQELFVIVAFSEHHVDRLVSMMKYIPFIGRYLQAPFKEYLSAQKAKLHQSRKRLPMQSTWLSWCFEKLLFFMVIYFVVSIINSMAQKYSDRLKRSQKTE